MRSTRKKVVQTVYKDENSDEEGGDFSDSGSEAKFSEESTSEEEVECVPSSGDEFDQRNKKTPSARKAGGKKPKFAKSFITKINKQMSAGSESETVDVSPALFSVKDLTDADKLLPSILNLSESDSSDDESPKSTKTSNIASISTSFQEKDSDSDNETNMEYKDVWANHIQENSEEIAKKTFMELEEHKSKVEEAKASLQNYTLKLKPEQQSADVKNLLALGEEALPEETATIIKKIKARKRKDDSDSEMEDWEEVKESKAIPRQGIQLFVEFPDAGCRKSKKLDVEMMMKRKINRVKKEYQVYMHKVHVLCWLGHGNFISRVLNDQDIMAAVLSLVPSKECYPGERVDMKYVEQITTWYKDKLSLKQDKNEDKFKPKAPPLKDILLEQIKKRVVTTKKYLVFVFVAMLRALGLQCRVMFNFVTVPIKPSSSELCSLSTKAKAPDSDKTKPETEKKEIKKDTKGKGKTSMQPKKEKISQVDGNDDDNSDFENTMQFDGSDDTVSTGNRSTRSAKRTKTDVTSTDKQDDNVSPPKLAKKGSGRASPIAISKQDKTKTVEVSQRTQRRKITKASEKNNEVLEKADSKSNVDATEIMSEKSDHGVSPPKLVTKTSGRKSPIARSKQDKTNIEDDTKKQQRGKNSGALTKTRKNTKPAENNKEVIDKGDSKSHVDATEIISEKLDDEVSPPKIARKSSVRSSPVARSKQDKTKNEDDTKKPQKEKNTGVIVKDKNVKNTKTIANKKETNSKNTQNPMLHLDANTSDANNKSPEKPAATNTRRKVQKSSDNKSIKLNTTTQLNIPKLSVTDENDKDVSSKYFADSDATVKNSRLPRKRSQTVNPPPATTANKDENKDIKPKTRTKSAPGKVLEKSKYFDGSKPKENSSKKVNKSSEDNQRVSHRDLAKTKSKAKNDITDDLVGILKNRIRDAKVESKKGLVKGKIKKESDEDSDYLPEEDPKRRSGSEDDFKPTKINPKPSTSRKIDRKVLSTTDEETVKKNKIDFWCEIFVEELEQWISVDVIKGKVHSTADLYNNATHPVCYIIGWDNNNYLKDLTRKYVPHWNTVTRKLRAEPLWLDEAIKPWLGPKTARDREENEYLDRMQLEAPLPKSIGEYKNHPLYALKRHLLKFEAIYPPDAAVLGFVRNEPVYARECVYTCRSRDTWLKEAKVVKLGEQPYKIVKARPKWDKLSNKLITDKPLEVFGPWQVQDYEPPVAENGIVPRNAYGNVELFKECMLPKGTVHIKLPSLNRVAKKLNIDCAPAMTGFDFNGGWSHPVYDGFVVCKEFEEIITEAWVKDQEEQERRELEKMEARVYGNWKRLIKGLMIRERLKAKYGFEEPPAEPSKKSKGPRLVVKKKS